MLKKSLTFYLASLLLISSNAEKIIIDTDAGSDDAVALLLLLRYEAMHPNTGFEIVGITCSYGNTREEQVEKNVLKTLSLVGRNNIPVYGGAQSGFLEPFTTDNYFGTDGFGNSNLDDIEVIVKVDKSKHAALAIGDLVKQHSGNVSILTLGPLTNLALAMNLDRNLVDHVKQFYIMGASVFGIGNRRPNVEFNIAADPEGAFVVFNSAKESQITLVPWESMLNFGTTKVWRRNTLGSHNTPYINFLNKVESKSLSTNEVQWITTDAIPAACIVEPSLIKETVSANIYVVTDGHARGSVLVDYSHLTKRVKNSKIIKTLDHYKFEEMLMQHFVCAEESC